MFNPIKDFIYDIQAYKLYSIYIKLSDITCYGIQTDFILVRNSKDELEKMITFDNKIGGLKYETNKYSIDTKIQMKDNEPVTFNKPKINIITVDDEYNVDDIKKKVDGLNNLLILGKYAGVGKPTLAVKLGTKILIINPYNALCQEDNKNGFDGITYDKLAALLLILKKYQILIK